MKQRGIKYLEEAKYNSERILNNIRELLPIDNNTNKADLRLLMKD